MLNQTHCEESTTNAPVSLQICDVLDKADVTNKMRAIKLALPKAIKVLKDHQDKLAGLIKSEENGNFYFFANMTEDYKMKYSSCSGKGLRFVEPGAFFANLLLELKEKLQEGFPLTPKKPDKPDNGEENVPETGDNEDDSLEPIEEKGIWVNLNYDKRTARKYYSNKENEAPYNWQDKIMEDKFTVEFPTVLTDGEDKDICYIINVPGNLEEDSIFTFEQKDCENYKAYALCELEKDDTLALQLELRDGYLLFLDEYKRFFDEEAKDIGKLEPNSDCDKISENQAPSEYTLFQPTQKLSNLATKSRGFKSMMELIPPYAEDLSRAKNTFQLFPYSYVTTNDQAICLCKLPMSYQEASNQGFTLETPLNPSGAMSEVAADLGSDGENETGDDTHSITTETTDSSKINEIDETSDDPQNTPGLTKFIGNCKDLVCKTFKIPTLDMKKLHEILNQTAYNVVESFQDDDYFEFYLSIIATGTGLLALLVTLTFSIRRCIISKRERQRKNLMAIEMPQIEHCELHDEESVHHLVDSHGKSSSEASDDDDNKSIILVGNSRRIAKDIGIQLEKKQKGKKGKKKTKTPSKGNRKSKPKVTFDKASKKAPSWNSLTSGEISPHFHDY